MEEVIIRIVSMPVGIRAITLKDEDWNYNVYINANLSKEEQELALQHEHEHIKRNDWNSSIPVCLIEQAVRMAVGK